MKETPDESPHLHRLESRLRISTHPSSSLSGPYVSRDVCALRRGSYRRAGRPRFTPAIAASAFRCATISRYRTWAAPR